MHSKTKNIQICHHFIRDHVQKDDISLKFIQTNFQLVDIFKKPFDEKESLCLLEENMVYLISLKMTYNNLKINSYIFLINDYI